MDGTFSGDGDTLFQELYTSLTEGASWHAPDHYYLLLDFIPYCDARLKANPDYNAPKVAILPTDTPLRLLSVRGAWLKVSCTTKTGRNVSGWLPPECVWANPYRHEWR